MSSVIIGVFGIQKRHAYELFRVCILMNFREVFQNANLLRSLSVMDNIIFQEYQAGKSMRMREGGWNRWEEREKRAAAFMR